MAKETRSRAVAAIDAEIEETKEAVRQLQADCREGEQKLNGLMCARAAAEKALKRAPKVKKEKPAIDVALVNKA